MNPSRQQGRTLRIFVMGQEPRSLRTVEIVNWTGLGFIGGRDHLKQIKGREELAEPGIYLLLSDSTEDGSGLTDIYIGETDNFADRIVNHAQSKDWWNQFVVFVSKDQNLTKAHVKHLERELYALAKTSLTTLRIRNSVEPGGTKLPESDISAMNEFLANMRFVLETLGLSYFPRAEAIVAHPPARPSEDSSTDGMQFYITLPKDLAISGAQAPRAIMQVVAGEFVLKAGSPVRRTPRDSFKDHSYWDLWKQITQSDAVTPTDNPNLFETTRNIPFNSASAAGAIVRGGQTNGRTDWKRTSDDKPLYQCQVEGIGAV